MKTLGDLGVGFLGEHNEKAFVSADGEEAAEKPPYEDDAGLELRSLEQGLELITLNYSLERIPERRQSGRAPPRRAQLSILLGSGFGYLSDVHSLANKGINGRDKGHKIQRILTRHPPQHQSSATMSPISTASHTAFYQTSLLPQQQLRPEPPGNL
ncbi:hypothetical protein VTG60DRAFT_6072 [Thermothelomyces hinnuleus]